MVRHEEHERAVEALDRTGESATARVFAARRALSDPEAALRDVLIAYARRQSRLSFAPPPACERDVRRLCRAAREQGIGVDPAAVLTRAVPDSRATVLERANAIRTASGLSPSERERRLADLLAAARAAGFDVERADVFDGRPGGDGRDDHAGGPQEAEASERVAGGDERERERDGTISGDEDGLGESGDADPEERAALPDGETLSSWLVGAGQNRIEDRP